MPPYRPPIRSDTAAALLARAARAQVEGRVPSLSVGVVRDGVLAWSTGRGSVKGEAPTPDTQYRIGSITKGFTAVLVMRLRDEGLLRLEDQLDRHVGGTPFGNRTIRDLLSHTAGLAAEPTGPWWERSPGRPWPELEASFTAAHVLRPPGQFHYSNVGYGLLGELVARCRGMSWYDALRMEVLRPLELQRTTEAPGWPSAPGLAVHPYADVVMPEVVQDLGSMAAAGQLWSTVADLARWVGFLLGDTGDVLAAGTVEEMRATQVIADDRTWETGYGLGVQIFRSGDRELVGHGGSVPGFLAVIMADVERRTATVELANATSGAPFSGPELLDIVESREPHVVDAWQPAGGVDDLLDAVGRWHWGPTPFTLTLRGSELLELTPLAGFGRATRIRRGDDGRWIGVDGYWAGESLHIERRENGSVSHLDLGTFVLTREPYQPDTPVPGGVDEHPWSS